jgi:hypothetical protein
MKKKDDLGRGKGLNEDKEKWIGKKQYILFIYGLTADLDLDKPEKIRKLCVTETV